MSALTAGEKEHFERDGWVGPFRYATVEEMAEVRTVLEREVIGTREVADRDEGGKRFRERHRDCRAVYEICANERIVARVSSLLGPEVVLWNTTFFCKGPGGKQIPWHQDRDFLFLDPCINVQVWLAIDPATLDNGCLRVIPGSHVSQVPHMPATARYQFTARADPRFVDLAKAVPLVLSPGEFVIVHKDLLHGSPTNLSMQRRMGLVARYTVPGVRVYEEGTTVPAPVYRV